MPGDVGIRLSMEETVSSVAPKVSEALRSIGEAGKELRDSLDLTGLGEEYKQFAERLDKIYDAQQAQKGPGQQMIQQVGGALPSVFRAGGGIVQRLGQTGDAVGAGADVMQTLGGIAKKAGPVAIGIAAFAGITAGLNALEMQYEKQIPELMDLTAILNRFGKSAQETSVEFKNVMDEVSEKAAEFGYSLEYGINITKSLAQISGAEGTRAIRGAGKVMRFERGYGVSSEALSRYMGLGLRFGQGERVFEQAAGGLQAADMGKGLFQEYLSATLDIFEQGLSRGIIKGFDEINLAQTWLAKIGDVFKGQYGLQVYRQMEQAIAGATSLASEGDVLIYRATKRFIEEQGPKGGPLSQLDVLMQMEQGLAFGKGGEKAYSMFDELREVISELTKSDEERIRILKQTLGLPSFTVAKELYYAESAQKFDEIQSEALKAMETNEGKLLTAQEEMKNYIRDIASGLTPIKVVAMEGLAGTVDKIADILGAKQEGRGAKLREKEYRERMKAEGIDIQRVFEMVGANEPFEAMMPTARLWRGSKLSRLLTGTIKKKGVSEDILTAAYGVSSVFEAAAKDEKLTEMLGSAKAVKRMYERATASTSPGGTKIVSEDLPAILRELNRVLGLLNLTIEKDKIINIDLIQGERGLPLGLDK